MAVATTAIGVLNNLIREELPAVLHESLPEIAPLFSQMETSTIDVVRNTGIGRGWKVLHLYETGVAGLIETAIPTGPTMNAMIGGSATDPQAHMLDIGSAATGLDIFPTAVEVPHTADMKRELSLHKSVGNYSLPVHWLQADALSATQAKKVGRDIAAVGKNKAIIEASSFFSYQATNASGYYNQVLGRLASAATDNAVTTGMIDFVIDEAYGRICNFRQGMSIDIHADSSGTLQDGVAVDATDRRNIDNSNSVLRLIITDIDFIAKRVTCMPIDTGDGTMPAFTGGWYGAGNGSLCAADDWVVVANTATYTGGSRPVHSWGMNDWIKSSGIILGGSAGDAGLDLAYYSQFKSSVVAVNSPLTDDVLNRYIAGYLDSYPGMTLDTIITTQGVNQQWLQQPQLGAGRFMYDRTGKSLSMKGGWSSVTYEWGGRTFNYVVSPMCLSNTLYACNFSKGNIKRYVPPSVGGSSSQVGGVEFLAPLGGHSGIFMVTHNATTGAPQDLLECPFWSYQLIAPIDPKGVKLTGLTEATMV